MHEPIRSHCDDRGFAARQFARKRRAVFKNTIAMQALPLPIHGASPGRPTLRPTALAPRFDCQSYSVAQAVAKQQAGNLPLPLQLRCPHHRRAHSCAIPGTKSWAGNESSPGRIRPYEPERERTARQEDGDCVPSGAAQGQNIDRRSSHRLCRSEPGGDCRPAPTRRMSRRC